MSVVAMVVVVLAISCQELLKLQKNPEIPQTNIKKTALVNA